MPVLDRGQQGLVDDPAILCAQKLGLAREEILAAGGLGAVRGPLSGARAGECRQGGCEKQQRKRSDETVMRHGLLEVSSGFA
jgi:hypothetical protein